MMRFEGLGEPYYEGGPRGPLLLTLLIAQHNPPPAQKDDLPTERASDPRLPGMHYGMPYGSGASAAQIVPPVPPPPPAGMGASPNTPMQINVAPRSYSSMPPSQFYQQ